VRREASGEMTGNMPRIIVIAGVASGGRQDTITLGLLEAYRRRGLRVQAFKVGPDFIDPGLHQLVTGRPSYNLDGWMCGREHVQRTVTQHGADTDLAIVEGVMGCFDGLDGVSDDGSTAQIAKWLGAPVILVVDARAQSRSAAAVVLGFERFDPALNIAGVIVNRVGGDRHAASVHAAIANTCRAMPLGALKRDEVLALPERHLGLVTAVEGVLTADKLSHLADAIETSIDLDRLLALSLPLANDGDPRPATITRSGSRALIGVAQDPAFQFYYAENLERLRAAGAELVFWSPLSDDALPNVDGLYVGGGYPELYARQLADNVAIRHAVRKFAESGKPIYAECGGLMFMAEAIEDLDGAPHAMVGLLPTTVRLRPRRLTLGYTDVQFTADSPLGPRGTGARGHEFHYSTLDPVPDSVPRVYHLRQRRGGERAEGYLVGGALMSYIHLHFASNPDLARNFVEKCALVRTHS